MVEMNSLMEQVKKNQRPLDHNFNTKSGKNSIIQMQIL